MTQPTPSTICPTWCERRHITGWHIHTAHIGEFTNGDSQRMDVGLIQNGGKSPLIVVSQDEDSRITLAPASSQQLFYLLGEALEALGVEATR